MKIKCNPFLINAVLLILNQFLIDANENIATVTVKPKQFNGFTKIINGKEVNIFLGIPYAKPPIGDLRFRKPVPFNYDNPIDATQWPNPCMQQIVPNLLFLFQNKNFSEDCLYLNIWSPNESSNEINGENEQTLKPVLFWIHGGGLLIGSSSMNATSGEILATKGNVVVTINYRLDYFGFLYSGTDDAPGNVGLWDQALALKWVNDNIKYFGGDPQSITIFGNSAGSLSVSLHLVSPITRHLFKNAIIMSGSIHPFFIKNSKIVGNQSLNVAKDFSCKSDTVKETVQCLRTVSANKLLIGLEQIFKSTVNAKPLYNEEFLPQNPIDMLKSGDYKKNVNVLFGTTDDEGSGLLGEFLDNVTYAEKNPKNISKSEAREQLKILFASFGVNESVINDVYKLYISQLPEHNYDLIRSSIGTVFGDYAVTCPSTRFAKLLFGFNKSGYNVNLYQYMFSGARKPNSWHGSDHGSDIVYWFGNIPQSNVSDKLVDTITHFARYGKPSPQEGIEWQSYYTIDSKLITPYYEITENPNVNESNYGFGFKYQCQYFDYSNE